MDIFVGRVKSGDITFYRYTRDNPTEPVILMNESNITESSTYFDKPTKLLVHGWTEHYNKFWYVKFRETYLSKQECAVIAVDWSPIAKSSYLQAVSSVKKTGHAIADSLVELENNKVVACKVSSIMYIFFLKVLQIKNIHVIAHSLGSHVGVYIAKRIIEKTGEKLNRVTLLDPAAPMFEFSVLGNMVTLFAINKDDAKFMDVVHTDAGHYGIKSPVGHIDFYPNGGTRVQPECIAKKDGQYILSNLRANTNLKLIDHR